MEVTPHGKYGDIVLERKIREPALWLTEGIVSILKGKPPDKLAISHPVKTLLPTRLVQPFDIATKFNNCTIELFFVFVF